MEIVHATRPTVGINVSGVVVGVAALIHLAASLLLLLAPYSFFMLFHHFPPYNRHDAGDLGAFQLPLGIALLLAAREPWRYRVVVLVAAAANLLQVLNHIYDGLTMPMTLVYWIADVGWLLVMAVALLVVYVRSAQAGAAGLDGR